MTTRFVPTSRQELLREVAELREKVATRTGDTDAIEPVLFVAQPSQPSCATKTLPTLQPVRITRLIGQKKVGVIPNKIVFLGIRHPIPLFVCFSPRHSGRFVRIRRRMYFFQVHRQYPLQYPHDHRPHKRSRDLNRHICTVELG
jgi:hypothetical protein